MSTNTVEAAVSVIPRTTREQALALAAMGARIITFQNRTKGPKSDNWPAAATHDPNAIHTWFDLNPNANYGVVGKPEIGAICGFDVDNAETLDMIRAETGHDLDRECPTFAVQTSRALPAGHRYFRQTARSVTIGNVSAPKLFEWRASNQQVVGPGSVHPTGVRYQAVDWTRPILDIPDWLVDWLRDYRNTNRAVQGVSRDLLMTPEEAAADVREKVDWVVGYLNSERKNRDNPARPVVYSQVPQHCNVNGLRGFKVYVRCPGKKDHSCDSGPSESAILVLPGIGLSFRCQHASHAGDEFNWTWYRKQTEKADDLADSIDVAGVQPPAPAQAPEDIFLARPLQGAWELSDAGNVKRLVDRYGDKILFLQGNKVEGYAWNGTLWEQGKGMILRLISASNQLIHEEANALASGVVVEGLRRLDPVVDARVKALRKWVTTSGMGQHMYTTYKLAGDLLARANNPLDADEWLLNVQNGTLDLRTQTLHPFNKSDMMSKRADVVFDASANCARWDAFLHRIMGGDREMIDFLARAVGYSITGSVKEEVLFFLFGDGANGKTTFCEVLRLLLGTGYAHTADLSLLTQRKFSDDGIPLDIQALMGKRFVTASESDKRARMNEAKLKKLVSNEAVTSRKLYHDLGSFHSSHHLFISSNHLPDMKGTDAGLWRRLLLLGFEVSIPEDEQVKDIQKLLLEERSGILNWILRGLKDYVAHGLNPPAKVRVETQQWRGDSDQLTRYLGEFCEAGENFQTASGLIYSSYKSWALENKEFTISSREFKDRLSALGYSWVHRNSGNYFTGLRLIGGGL